MQPTLTSPAAVADVEGLERKLAEALGVVALPAKPFDPNAPAVRLDVPGQFLKGIPMAEREAALIRMLRHRQVPIKGSHKITGLRWGFLRMTRRHSHLVFEWWKKDPRSMDERNAAPGNIETREY